MPSACSGGRQIVCRRWRSRNAVNNDTMTVSIRTICPAPKPKRAFIDIDTSAMANTVHRIAIMMSTINRTQTSAASRPPYWP